MTAPPIQFHSARFAPPSSLQDTSVLSFVDRAASPSVSMTVARESLAGGADGLKVYVDEQQRAAQKAVPGYASVSIQPRTLSGAAGIFVEGVAPSEKSRRCVLQLYVLDAAQGQVFIVTATARDADAQRARDAMEQVAGSFTLEGAR